jgi:hypothetical protein
MRRNFLLHVLGSLNKLNSNELQSNGKPRTYDQKLDDVLEEMTKPVMDVFKGVVNVLRDDKIDEKDKPAKVVDEVLTALLKSIF